MALPARRTSYKTIAAAGGMGILALALLPEVVEDGATLVELAGFVLALAGPVLMLGLLLRRPAVPVGQEDLGDLNAELRIYLVGIVLFFGGLVVFMQR